MSSSLAADAVVLLHFVFILFVVLGGLFVLRWHRLIWLHLPAAVWGGMVELADWYCPLTYLENALRRGAGGGYSSGFIEHYIMPLVYPAGLTSEMRIVLGGVVLVINGALYTVLFRKRRTGVANHPGSRGEK